MKNVVIAKYLDGRMVKGTTLDIGNKQVFHLQTEDGENLTINLNQLKAVFFLRTAYNAAQSQKVRAGAQVRVKFHDGEEILGNSFDFNLKKDHFFVFPIDDSGSNERIMVNRRAAKYVSNLGGSVSGKESERIAFDPRVRMKLEHEIYKSLYNLAQSLHGQGAQPEEAVIAAHYVLLKKKLEPIIERYESDFGREAWEQLVDEKLREIRLNLGDQVHDSVQRIVSRI